ncbi:hypothetical protein ACIRRA_44480 [Nocardia sp. NPDC101769]|uniref:hypothetical protein n=1 Tax=Nocardia sp. NPDC101769 TaxID=3364333 RepID=UPI00380CAE8F
MALLLDLLSSTAFRGLEGKLEFGAWRALVGAVPNTDQLCVSPLPGDVLIGDCIGSKLSVAVRV